MNINVIQLLHNEESNRAVEDLTSKAPGHGGYNLVGSQDFNTTQNPLILVALGAKGYSEESDIHADSWDLLNTIPNCITSNDQKSPRDNPLVVVLCDDVTEHMAQELVNKLHTFAIYAEDASLEASRDENTGRTTITADGNFCTQRARTGPFHTDHGTTELSVNQSITMSETASQDLSGLGTASNKHSRGPEGGGGSSSGNTTSSKRGRGGVGMPRSGRG